MREFIITGGGCAANAAIAVARLGAAARFCGPLGDDPMSAQIVDGLVREKVDVAAVTRVAGAVASVSGIFVDPGGERLLTTRRERGLETAQPPDAVSLVTGVDAVLADNHFAGFVLPICRAATGAGIPVVLDIDKPTEMADPLLAAASHVVFSAEALRVTTGTADVAAALRRTIPTVPGFVAVTDGAAGVHWLEGNAVCHQPAFAIDAIDTLAAGDVFHAALALALAEGSNERVALRFASAAAALKCTRFGGIAGSPARAAVDELLQSEGSV